MPAVTADTMTLPRLSVDPASTLRTVKTVTNAPQGYEGEGFPVRRAFAGVDPIDLDPFILIVWSSAGRSKVEAMTSPLTERCMSVTSSGRSSTSTTIR